MEKGHGVGMEWGMVGVMEYWIVGLFAVRRVCFFDDEAINPIARFPFSFQAFHQFQQAILQFEGQSIHGLKIIFGDLFCFPIRMQPRNGLAKGAQAKIQKIQILTDGAAAISLGDVPVNGISGGDGLRRHFFHFKREPSEDTATHHIKINRIMPNPKLLVAAIFISKIF
jgi:hypothetical protein